MTADIQQVLQVLMEDRRKREIAVEWCQRKDIAREHRQRDEEVAAKCERQERETRRRL